MAAAEAPPAFDAERGTALPVHARLACLFHLKLLLDLARAPTKLRYTVLKPRAPKADGPAADGDAATTAAAGEGDAAAATSADAATATAADADADADAAADAAPPRVTIKDLRFVPDELVAGLLAAFTEARADAQSAEARTSLAMGALRAVAAELASSEGRELKAAPAAAAAGVDVPGGIFVRTAQLTDKLLAHIAALALAVDGYDCDVRLLAADTRLAPDKLANTFRELGCAVKPLRVAEGDAAAAAAGRRKGAIVSYSAVLRVPLVFPKAKLGRSRA